LHLKGQEIRAQNLVLQLLVKLSSADSIETINLEELLVHLMDQKS
jgi:hypothetical protein